MLIFIYFSQISKTKVLWWRDRTYQAITQFIPIQFDPEDSNHLCQFEIFNGLESSLLLKAEWIKPIKDQKPNQRVATLRMSLWDCITANKILKEGASILNRQIVPKKPKKEPICCMYCQCFGHKNHSCSTDAPNCGRCTGPHKTNECMATQPTHKCANCKGNHLSYNRGCPRFQEKCHQTDSHCSENTLAFYPTSKSWTWSTFSNLPLPNSSFKFQCPPPPLLGTNNAPLRNNYNNWQPQSSNPPPVNSTTSAHLRIWQQNLNHSLTSQLHLPNSVHPNNWDVLILQEPWMGHLGTCSSPHWRVPYPDTYFVDNTEKPHSLILINTNLPTNSYEQIHFNSPDITGILIAQGTSKIILINIYNNCNHNNALDSVSTLLTSQFQNNVIPDNTHLILAGDFNRHHAWWESPHDTHLTSSEVAIKPLLDLVFNLNLRLALPPNLPTLYTLSTGNWTRLDNVWCSNHTSDLIIKCDTDPGPQGPNTEHLPILTILDIPLTQNVPCPTCNFHATDWNNFLDHLTSLLNTSTPQTPLLPYWTPSCTGYTKHHNQINNWDNSSHVKALPVH